MLYFPTQASFSVRLCGNVFYHPRTNFSCIIFFIVSGKAVTKRWGNLRDAFSKSKRKLKECKKSGAGATKIKKYVYADQMQFLSKLYQSRTVAESLEDGRVNIDDGDADDEQNEQSIVKETEGLLHREEGSSRENNTASRKRRRPDEVELKMLKALEEPIPSAHMMFFQGLLPHLNKFDDGEVLEFQMGVLQVISNINDKRKRVQPLPPQTLYYNQNYPHSQQPSFPQYQPIHSNQLNTNNTFQAPFPQTHHLQNPQHFNQQFNTNNQVPSAPSLSQRDQNTAQQFYQQFGHSTESSTDNYESPSPCTSVGTDNTIDFS